MVTMVETTAETMVVIMVAMVVIPALLFVDLILMIMVSEFASAKLVSSWEPTDVSLENPAEPTKSELLMEAAAASLDSLTTMVFAQNVPAELSGALLPTNVSMFADKTQPMTPMLPSVSALKALD